MDDAVRQHKMLIIVVHYKSSGSLAKLISSLDWLKESLEVHLAVVDNSSGEEELKPIRQLIDDFPNASLLELPVNRGYFGAASHAFDHYLAQGRSAPDWVIVCNHDVLVEDRGFADKLLHEDCERIGVIAPSIRVLPGEREQNPFMRRRPGRLRCAQIRLISSNYTLSLLWDWLWRRKAALRHRVGPEHSLATGDRGRETVYAAHGSFVVFSRRYFEAGGFLDPNLFLYGEEISVAEICRSLNLSIVYEPKLRVLHNEHRSTGGRMSRFTFECQKKAVRYLATRYLSSSKGSATPDLQVSEAEGSK